jgi:hypothetical protein
MDSLLGKVLRGRRIPDGLLYHNSVGAKTSFPDIY